MFVSNFLLPSSFFSILMQISVGSNMANYGKGCLQILLLFLLLTLKKLQFLYFIALAAIWQTTAKVVYKYCFFFGGIRRQAAFVAL